MTPAEYRAFVASMLTYPGALSYERCAIGAATEVAEALAYVAKCRWQGHAFDRETLALELGDVLFYLAGIDAALEVEDGELPWWNDPLEGQDDCRMDHLVRECRALYAAGSGIEQGQGAGHYSNRAIDDCWSELATIAAMIEYSLADLAALNVAKLRARYAATGGEFDAAGIPVKPGDDRHHDNRDKDDNRLKNLVVIDHAQHSREHAAELPRRRGKFAKRAAEAVAEAMLSTTGGGLP